MKIAKANQVKSVFHTRKSKGETTMTIKLTREELVTDECLKFFNSFANEQLPQGVPEDMRREVAQLAFETAAQVGMAFIMSDFDTEENSKKAISLLAKPIEMIRLGVLARQAELMSEKINK
jgi:hypothetical protein